MLALFVYGTREAPIAVARRRPTLRRSRHQLADRMADSVPKSRSMDPASRAG